jgi:hypothetical protein
VTRNVMVRVRSNVQSGTRVLRNVLFPPLRPVTCGQLGPRWETEGKRRYDDVHELLSVVPGSMMQDDREPQLQRGPDATPQAHTPYLLPPLRLVSKSFSLAPIFHGISSAGRYI